MPNYKFTVDEKIAMVRQHYQGMSYRRISDHFAAAYPDRPIPANTTIRKIILAFERRGNVDGRLHKVKQLRKQLTIDTQLSICLSVEEDPLKPTSRIAQEIGVCKSSIRNVLRDAKYHAYKFENHQELLHGDPGRRVTFCEGMMDLYDQNPGLRVCFSDESTVFLTSKPNKQNTRAWSQHNPHFFVQTGTQYPIKVNVWVGMIEDNIMGPFFIDGNLTGEKYLRLLREQIVPAIRAVEADGNPVWFQQDGAPPHFTVAVRAYLDQEFPNRWIGRGSPILQWPARSPDMNPLDYGLWAFLKNKLYNHNRIENRERLQARIVEVLENMSPEFVSNITNAFYYRLGYCMITRGEHFEHRMRKLL